MNTLWLAWQGGKHTWVGVPNSHCSGHSSFNQSYPPPPVTHSQTTQQHWLWPATNETLSGTNDHKQGAGLKGSRVPGRSHGSLGIMNVEDHPEVRSLISRSVSSLIIFPESAIYSAMWRGRWRGEKSLNLCGHQTLAAGRWQFNDTISMGPQFLLLPALHSALLVRLVAGQREGPVAVLCHHWLTRSGRLELLEIWQVSLSSLSLSRWVLIHREGVN